MKCAAPLILLLVLTMAACQVTEKEKADSSSYLKDAVTVYVDSCWNKGEFSALNRIVGEEFVRNLNGLEVANGRIELEAYIQNYIKAFPNLRITITKLIEKEGKVALEWTFKGTNTGVFAEFIPTGKKATVSGVSMMTFNSQGKLIQENTYYNELYLLQQLGFTLNPPNLE
ncbi:MAG: ester cyclase [Muriicola sp.]|nr:ester cyclase [Muriicola sp.]NNK09837.1 SnoaL-like domain-containing protein [Flavobacteriaceae bacterium]